MEKHIKKQIRAIAIIGSVTASLLTSIFPGIAVDVANTNLNFKTVSLENIKQNININSITRALPQTLAFTDIQGVYGETQIRQLSQLGVIESEDQTFSPLSPISRSQFVVWLVKTYNLLQTHNTRNPAPIRLPDTQTSSFSDVPPNHPAFPYIQAAYNAGFLVGYEDGTFRPDAYLTREEMIVLKSPLDSRGSGNSKRSVQNLRNFIQKTKGFTDTDQISERYLSHIAFDLGNATSGRNFQRVYGSTRLFEPQKTVTKAEAAVLLSQFRKAGTVTQALEKINRTR